MQNQEQGTMQLQKTLFFLSLLIPPIAAHALAPNWEQQLLHFKKAALVQAENNYIANKFAIMFNQPVQGAANPTELYNWQVLNAATIVEMYHDNLYLASLIPRLRNDIRLLNGFIAQEQRVAGNGH